METIDVNNQKQINQSIKEILQVAEICFGRDERFNQFRSFLLTRLNDLHRSLK